METKRECRHPRRTDRRMRALKHAERRVGFWDRVVTDPEVYKEYADHSHILTTDSIRRLAGRRRDIAIEEVGNLRRKLNIQILSGIGVE